MNILFVHSIGKKKFGGGERWLIAVANGLKSRGHRVIVVGSPGSRLLDAAMKSGLESEGMNIYSDISLYHAFKLSGIIRKQKIDVVISRDRDIAVAGLAAGMGGNPLVIVRYGSPLRRSFRKHAFLLGRFADGVITNTHSIKEEFESRKITEKGFVRVIYNGLFMRDDKHKYDFSARFPGKKIILSVGRLTVHKGYMYLIDAVEMLGSKFDDLMFVLLGEGKHHGKLAAYARRKGVDSLVQFEGYVDNVIPYLRGCDIFVLPSLYEGMPNAAMEAMAYGKPVILTEVNGARELIPDENKGILIPAHDAAAIAGTVERLLGDSELCLRMGKEAAGFINNNFTESAMIDNIESYIFEKLAEKKL